MSHPVFAVPMRTRFRGIDVREGMLLRGDAGWGEFSPFLEYDARVAEPWLRAALEAADEGWPAPLRDRVPVNVTVPAVDAERARAIVLAGGCTTAKVKVAEPGQSTRRRRGPGRGGARRARPRRPHPGRRQRRLERRRGGHRHRPARPRRRRPGVRRAAVRRASRTWPGCAGASTYRSPPTSRSAAPRTPTGCATWRPPTSRCSRCSRSAGCGRACGSPRTSACPVVVSSALETSVGIAAGVALAAALPALEHACGLATVQLLTADVAQHPLLPVDGELPVERPQVDPVRLAAVAAAPDAGRALGGAAGRDPAGSTLVSPDPAPDPRPTPRPTAAPLNAATAQARTLLDELVRGGVADVVALPGLALGRPRLRRPRRGGPRRRHAAHPHRRAHRRLPRPRPGPHLPPPGRRRSPRAAPRPPTSTRPCSRPPTPACRWSS